MSASLYDPLNRQSMNIAEALTEEQYISTFFCRALYDYQSTDPSSLSFSKGEIIEVLTQLESGWWDGLLNDERGWFPSNYVVPIDEAEAEEAFMNSAQGSSSQTYGNGSDLTKSSYDGTPSQSGSYTSREGDWLTDAMALSQDRSEMDDLGGTSMHLNGRADDFWIPEVTSDGQIFYVNSKTGERSRELPGDAEDDATNLDHLSRPRTMMSSSGSAGPSSSERSGRQGGSVTPEPWIKRVAEDNVSYYYINTLDDRISWTRPEPTIQPTATKLGSSSARDREDTPTSSNVVARNRAYSNAQNAAQRSLNPRLSVYSDDSDVQPRDFEYDRSTSVSRMQKESETPMTSRSRSNSQTGLDSRTNLHQYPKQNGQLTSAEKVSMMLRERLTPPPPESLTMLSHQARDSISHVLECFNEDGTLKLPVGEVDLKTLVDYAVLDTRNLLYVCVNLSGNVSQHTSFPQSTGIGSNADSSAHTALVAHLKPLQRKVTATLSKLVLSTRAFHLNPSGVPQDTISRVEQDAQELDRALVAFITEVERQQEVRGVRSTIGKKRLHAVLTPGAELGIGVVGGGSAANWKGFGFVRLEDGLALPSSPLDADAISGLRNARATAEDRLATLQNIVHDSLNNGDTQDARDIFVHGQDALTEVGTYLRLVADINIARHVDVDAIKREYSDHRLLIRDDPYSQAVERGRVLVRELEAATQSMHDDAAMLLDSLQIRGISERASEDRRHNLTSQSSIAINSIRANLSQILEIIEALLRVGHNQEDAHKGDYHGSLEWRLSRVSTVVPSSIAGTVRPESQYLDELDVEDVVDMELALQRPAARPANDPMDTLHERFEGGGQRRGADGMASKTEDSTFSRSSSFHDLQTDTSSKLTLIDGIVEESKTAFSDDDRDLEDDSDNEELSVTTKSPPRSKKIEQFFGAAPKGVIDTINADAMPWYLRPDYSNTEILINPDGGIRGGTPGALVERLTSHLRRDTIFNNTFFLTYKSFMKPDTLVDLLVNRYRISPPEGLKPEELKQWTQEKQKLIRICVLNTFKTMITDDGILDRDDVHIYGRIKEFLSERDVLDSNGTLARQILGLAERAQSGEEAVVKTTLLPGQAPTSILPKSSKKLKLLDIDPLELARQLTIMESRYFCKITAAEILQRPREKTPGESSDNITSVINTSNKIAYWVADAILSKEDSRKRAATVKQFIAVADRCRTLNNFSTMVALISGLNSPPIRRLKRTWEQVNARMMSQLSACEMTIDAGKNFSNYKAALAKVNPPCVPFIGVYLTVLTFIHDGSKDILDGGLINFGKRQKTAEVIREIKHWQSKPYQLTPIIPILTFLEESMDSFQGEQNDLFWNLSLEREPREREDEKMARLLQESGFL